MGVARLIQYSSEKLCGFAITVQFPNYATEGLITFIDNYLFTDVYYTDVWLGRVSKPAVNY